MFLNIQKLFVFIILTAEILALCYIFFYFPASAVSIVEVKSSCLNIAAQVCGVTYVS